MRSSICLSTLILLLITGCEKEKIEASDDRKDSYHRVSRKLDPYLFERTSWWVYSKEGDTLIDSVVVTDFSFNTYTTMPSHPGQGDVSYIDYYSISYASSAREDYGEALYGTVISRGFIYGGWVYGAYLDEGEKSGQLWYLDSIPEMRINQTIFNGVKKIQCRRDELLMENSVFYYVDSVGVVRKEIEVDDDVEIWNLLRYNVSLYNRSSEE